jgi:uncharacterized glyoxalase superfamily protein PhnB
MMAQGFQDLRSPITSGRQGLKTATLEEAVAAGAALIKPGQKVFWGGYSGYFAEPDGFYWEVAYNPFL